MTSPLTRKRLSLAVCGLALLACSTLRAQTASSEPVTQDTKPSDSKAASSLRKPDPREFVNNYPADWTVKTYFLRNTTTQNDANEILVALRNMLLPSARIFLDASANAIVVFASPDQHQMTVNLIHDLDRPKQAFRLTYTFTEFDNGKRVGIQHHSLSLVTGQRVTFKEGSKIPVLTGSYAPAQGGSAQQQFQYIDVGLNLDATIDSYGNGARLRTKVEQSGSAEDKTISGITEPVIRQSVFEGAAILVPGKPCMLGSIEIPNTTRRFDIEVTADLLP